jgi:hypothetical protein
MHRSLKGNYGPVTTSVCYDIGLHSAANGVWLPVKSSVMKPTDKFLIVNTDTLVEWTITAHKKHSRRYGEFLKERLDGLDTREDILHEISEIRKLLLNGEIDLVNPIK